MCVCTRICMQLYAIECTHVYTISRSPAYLGIYFILHALSTQLFIMLGIAYSYMSLYKSVYNKMSVKLYES